MIDTETKTPTNIITITGDEPMVIDPASAKRRPMLDAEEARMLTAEIRRTSVRLWLLITEAHDRAAHFALGYDNWDDYVRSEFNMSPSRSYQLIDTGHVMRAMAAAGADIEHLDPPPARVVAKVKNRLVDVRRVTKAAIKEHTPPEAGLRELAREAVTPTPPTTKVEPEAETPEAEGKDRRSTALITCPACQGEGKVNRSLYNRVRAFLKTLDGQETKTA